MVFYHEEHEEHAYMTFDLITTIYKFNDEDILRWIPLDLVPSYMKICRGGDVGCISKARLENWEKLLECLSLFYKDNRVIF